MSAQSLRGGTWNMERDRDKINAAHKALEFMDQYELDFLCLQESGDYLTALGALCTPQTPYRAIFHRSAVGMDNTAILIRRTIDSGPGHQVRMTKTGWITVRGGHTGPKYMTTVLLDGWLRVGSVHLPVSERWMHGRITGPLRRVAAYVQHAKSLADFIGQYRSLHPNMGVFIAGDWNSTPSDRGEYTPFWIAACTSANGIMPRVPTHHARLIDYALAAGCSASASTRETGGSDHHLVTFDVHPIQ